MVVIVCLVCGDQGFVAALDLCHNCQECASHRYCQKVLPKDLSEDTVWYCEDCEPDVAKPFTVKSSCSPGRNEPEWGENDIEDWKLNKRRRLFLKEEEEEEASQLSVTDPLKASSKNEESNSNDNKRFEEEKILVSDNGLDEIQDREKHESKVKFKGKTRLDCKALEEKPVEDSDSLVNDAKASNLSQPTLVTCSGAEMKSQLQHNESSHGIEMRLEKHNVVVRDDLKAREKCDNDANVRCEKKCNEDRRPDKQRFVDSKDFCSGTLTTSRVVVTRHKSANRSEQHKVIRDLVGKPAVKIYDNGRLTCITQDKDKHTTRDQKFKEHSYVEEDEDDKIKSGSEAKGKVQIRGSRASGKQIQMGGGMDKEAAKSPKTCRRVSSSESKPCHRKLVVGSETKRLSCGNDEKVGKQGMRLVGASGFRHSNISQHRVASSPVDAVNDSKPSNISLQNVRPVKQTHVGHEQKHRDRQRTTQASNTKQCDDEAPAKQRVADEDEKAYNIHFIYHDPVWRGNFSIYGRNSSTFIDTFQVVAHLSILANARASDVAQMLLNPLRLDIFSRSQLWPKCFQKSGPTSHHVALCFFPDNRSDVFENLVEHMILTDLAMIAVFKQVELVVFTSHEWPTNCQRIESKYFLWGGFRTRKPSALMDRLKCQQLNDKVGE